MAAFELCFSIRIFKEERYWRDCRWISLFYIQIQEPTSRSTTTRALDFLAKFTEFYYHKISETRSWWRPKRLRGWTLPLCLLCNWRYKDLSVSRDQKVMTLLPPWRRALSASITELLSLSKFDNTSPSITEIKRFVTWLWANDITSSWDRVPNGTLSMFTYCLNLMFLASLWLEINRFSNWSFCWLRAVQNWYSFC